MKIVIAINENNLDSPIALQFGKSQWFCIYDSVADTNEYIQNPMQHSSSIDFCESADLFIEKGIQAAVATRFGSKIIEYFRSQNVQMIMTEPNRQANSIINIIK